MHALTATLVAIALTAGAPVSLWSQWQIGGEIGVARFGGTSRDTDGTKVAPYRPTTLALSLGREVGRARVSLTVLHAKIGQLTLENDFLSGALSKAGLLSGKR